MNLFVYYCCLLLFNLSISSLIDAILDGHNKDEKWWPPVVAGIQARDHNVSKVITSKCSALATTAIKARHNCIGTLGKKATVST